MSFTWIVILVCFLFFPCRMKFNCKLISLLIKLIDNLFLSISSFFPIDNNKWNEMKWYVQSSKPNNHSSSSSPSLALCRSLDLSRCQLLLVAGLSGEQARGAEEIRNIFAGININMNRQNKLYSMELDWHCLISNIMEDHEHVKCIALQQLTTCNVLFMTCKKVHLKKRKKKTEKQPEHIMQTE